MTRKFALIFLTLVSFYYCFRFGYIWTAYGHGGQLLGIPFALTMLIITITYFTSKTYIGKDKVFAFGIIYFLTLAAFSMTIETIRAAMKSYFEFLYYEPGGYVNKILLGWIILGIMAMVFKFRQINKMKPDDRNF